MHCPACSTPALETDTACRQCGFTVEMTDQAFGIPPVITPPLADLAQVLSASEQRALRTAVRSLEQRLPQISASVVLTSAPVHAPLPVYAFWLFNRASLFSAAETAGDNRGLLILLDVTRNEALVMPGYGLEPFVPRATLQHCIDAGGGALEQSRFAEAAMACLSELERELTTICLTLPKAFGLTEDAQLLASLDEGAPALAAAGSDDDLF